MAILVIFISLQIKAFIFTWWKPDILILLLLKNVDEENNYLALILIHPHKHTYGSAESSTEQQTSLKDSNIYGMLISKCF